MEVVAVAVVAAEHGAAGEVAVAADSWTYLPEESGLCSAAAHLQVALATRVPSAHAIFPPGS